jgi:hypothetical protein
VISLTNIHRNLEERTSSLRATITTLLPILIILRKVSVVCLEAVYEPVFVWACDYKVSDVILTQCQLFIAFQIGLSEFDS